MVEMFFSILFYILGTSSFSDFTNSRNHRFSTLASAQRNRIVYPTEQLHFFNLPLSYEAEHIQSVRND
jgi:heterogeneous nuclear ribonucleoprotein L